MNSRRRQAAGHKPLEKPQIRKNLTGPMPALCAGRFIAAKSRRPRRYEGMGTEVIRFFAYWIGALRRNR